MTFANRVWKSKGQVQSDICHTASEGLTSSYSTTSATLIICLTHPEGLGDSYKWHLSQWAWRSNSYRMNVCHNASENPTDTATEWLSGILSLKVQQLATEWISNTPKELNRISRLILCRINSLMSRNWTNVANFLFSLVHLRPSEVNMPTQSKLLIS